MSRQDCAVWYRGREGGKEGRKEGRKFEYSVQFVFWVFWEIICLVLAMLSQWLFNSSSILQNYFKIVFPIWIYFVPKYIRYPYLTKTHCIFVKTYWWNGQHTCKWFIILTKTGKMSLHCQWNFHKGSDIVFLRVILLTCNFCFCCMLAFSKEKWFFLEGSCPNKVRKVIKFSHL